MVQEEPVEDYLQDMVSGVLNTEDHKQLVKDKRN